MPTKSTMPLIAIPHYPGGMCAVCTLSAMVVINRPNFSSAANVLGCERQMPFFSEKETSEVRLYACFAASVENPPSLLRQDGMCVETIKNTPTQRRRSSARALVRRPMARPVSSLRHLYCPTVTTPSRGYVAIATLQRSVGCKPAGLRDQNHRWSLSMVRPSLEVTAAADSAWGRCALVEPPLNPKHHVDVIRLT